jgi:hypothetical protein
MLFNWSIIMNNNLLERNFIGFSFFLFHVNVGIKIELWLFWHLQCSKHERNSNFKKTWIECRQLIFTVLIFENLNSIQMKKQHLFTILVQIVVTYIFVTNPKHLPIVINKFLSSNSSRKAGPMILIRLNNPDACHRHI